MKLKKRILVNNSALFTIKLELSEDSTRIEQVVVESAIPNLKKRFHITYHNTNQKNKHLTQRTHVTSDKEGGNKTDKYSFVNNFEEGYACTVWLNVNKSTISALGVSEINPQSDINILITNESVAFRFWVTESNKLFSNSEIVIPSPFVKKHEHTPWSNKMFGIERTKINELQVEILEACCPGFKRAPFDPRKRDLNAISQEFGIFDGDGLKIVRYVPKGVVPGL